jgi:PAS domain S-box-containing protein
MKEQKTFSGLGQAATAARAKILVVDDNPTNLLVLRAILSEYDQDLVEARSGEEALVCLEQDDFAVVLLDVQMPGMNGFETAQQIRARSSERVPLIFITAYDSDQFPVERAYALGAVDYLVKPLIPVVVQAKVAGFVELYQAKVRARLEAEQLRLLVAGVQDYAIFLLDPQGIVASWNPGAERITQYRAEEIIGQHFSRFYTQEAIDRGWPAEELKVTERTGRLEEEGWRVRRDGTEYWSNVIVTALRDETGQLRGFAKITRDMTEQKRAEASARRLVEETTARRVAEENSRVIQAERERLQESEQRFARFMQHLPGLAWIKDPQGRYVYVNDAAARAFGVERGRLYGKTDDQVFAPDTAARFTANDREALASEHGVQVVETLAQDDGLLHYSLVNKFPIFGAQNIPAFVGGMAIDITDRQRAEAALREAMRHKDKLLATLQESERFHRAIAELSTDYAFGGKLCAEGVVAIETVTEGFAKFYGLTLPEMNARGGWRSVIHPDDHSIVGKTIAKLLAGEIDRGVLRGVHRDGSVKWQSYLVLPVHDPVTQQVTGIYGAATDITAQRLMTDRLQEQAESLAAILSATVDHIYLIDGDGRYRYVSAGGARLLGRSPAEMSGRTWRDIGLPAELMEPFDAQRRRAIRTGMAQRHEITHYNERNEPRHFEYTIAPVAGMDAELGSVVVVARDDTERMRAEESLRDADRRKDEFLATLAHELRNPLAPIRNSLQILKLPRLEPEIASQAREMMERQVHHLVRLVDDLLDVSRVMRGKIELRKESCELSSIVARAVETAQPLIDAQQHQLDINLPAESLQVFADPIRLAQVISNVLTNAAKYTDPNGHIRLSASRVGEQVELRVKDNGIGIAPAMLDQIFELFVQADQSSVRAQGGLGIGLTLVKNLVELHGGTVAAISQGLGAGTEIVVSLPLHREIRQACPVEDNGDEAAKKSFAGRRLLVVDDNRDAATTLAMLLRLQGCEVHVANDGLAALEAAAHYQPELIFLDIGMPGMDGYEVARRIRRTPGLKHIVLAALTGWGQQEDRRRSAEAGFDHHLVKPVQPGTLESILASVGSSPKAMARQ